MQQCTSTAIKAVLRPSRFYQLSVCKPAGLSEPQVSNLVVHEMASRPFFGRLHELSSSKLQHLSRTWTALVCLLCCVYVSVGEEFTVEWYPEGVRGYNTSNPLVVELGDKVILRCPREGNYTYSNVWIQNHEKQYNDCDCMAVPEQNCDPVVTKTALCAIGAADPIVRIIQNDAELNSVLNFNTGRLYYLTSYTAERSLAGAFSEMSMGGQCLDGLKMVMEVLEIPTQPMTADTVETSTVSTQVPSAGEGTSTFPPNVSTEPSMESITGTKDTIIIEQIVLLPSRELRDWHVAIIVVLGVSILALIAIFVVVALGIMLYRRRGRLAVNPVVDSTTEDECKIDMTEAVLAPETSASYPVEVFDDPLDII